MLVPRKKWTVPQLTRAYGRVRVPRNLDCTLVHWRSLLPRSKNVLTQNLLPSRWWDNHSEIRVKRELGTQEIWSWWVRWCDANSTTMREIKISRKWKRRQDSCRIENQDFVAPAPSRIPLWAAGLVTPFVTPAWRENAFCSCVLDSSRHSEAEWENERIRGRPKADQMAQWNQVELCNWAWETEMKRWAG